MALRPGAGVTIGLFSKRSAVVVLAAMVIYDLAFHQTWRAAPPDTLRWRRRF